MNKRNWIIALGLLVLPVLLASCTSPEPAPAATDTPAEAAATVTTVQAEFDLANTAWQMDSFGGPEDSLPAIPDSYPDLHFMLDRYSGYNGCDWYLGVYTISDGQIFIETPATTEGGCEEVALGQQGATFVGSLTVANQYEVVDENLLLYDSDGQLLLTMTPLPALPFEGTLWHMKFMSTQPAYWQPTVPGSVITAQFDGETLTGNAGCNEYSATYTRDDNGLTLGDLTVTSETCSEPEGVMEQETEYLDLLATTTGIAESERSMELFTDDGVPLFLYHGE